MTHQIALAFEDGITRFVECEDDQTVADAAYQARINIPFDCRDGACGTCKAFCESGDYEDGDYIEDALSDDEAAEGYCLPCQMTPNSDLILQIATTSVLAKTGAATFDGELVELNRLSDSTFGISVKLENRKDLAYLPGQYMNILVPGTEQTRSYSFSSSTEEDVVSFLIKNTPGGLMTTYLDETAAVGDKLELTGPMGSFFLREPVRPILLLAGGTGLAPILAILEKLAIDELLDVPIRMVYGANFDYDLVELERLESFKDKIGDFDYITVLSDPDTEHERKGFVPAHLVGEYEPNEDTDVYLCGPPPMVEAVRKFFGTLDNPPLDFYYEKFTSAAGTPGETGVSVTTETIEDSRDGEERSVIEVSAPGMTSGEVHSSRPESESQLEARMALELGALELAIKKLGNRDIERFRALAETANSFIDGDRIIDAVKFTEANADFHEFLFRRADNAALIGAYQNLAVVTEMKKVLPGAEWIDPNIATEHLELVDAVAAQDLAKAQEIIRSHAQHGIETMRKAEAE
ncbi:benzoate 1,2-dioxygenase electron transfer component BenC [uncultured Corynebacterium sp.]|uniref:benzoate 1,2-dioxygenase electron transfer component BenC n=1 Tax=uncultured Corynebacterium sp. TaxID=159447 RepID=UPI00260057FA|nr:benzoate 1,2-dioxygenase electron transfer component BenC [uncultured Corynebacterium sp.]